jgi:hypothetical protein
MQRFAVHTNSLQRQAFDGAELISRTYEDVLDVYDIFAKLLVSFLRWQLAKALAPLSSDSLCTNFINRCLMK